MRGLIVLAALPSQAAWALSAACATEAASLPAREGACPAAAVATAAARREDALLQVAARRGRAEASSAASASASRPVGFRSSSRTAGDGQWCKALAPGTNWTLRRCFANGNRSLQEFSVLTYNLFWWNLFGPAPQRDGNGGSAGKLINASGPFDFMGFQECEDIGRVLRDGGLERDYGVVPGDHATAIAYRRRDWRLLEQGAAEVAEDRPEQWWGTRGAQWARFRHRRSGRTIFFANHHGPLPVDTGGLCGGLATAWSLLKMIGTNADRGDGIVLVGDFNAGVASTTVQELRARLRLVHTGVSFGGVDHVFTSCSGDRVRLRRNLGNGGSDHDALKVKLRL